MPFLDPVEQAVADAKVFHDRARALQAELDGLAGNGGSLPEALVRRRDLAQERADQATDDVLAALGRYG